MKNRQINPKFFEQQRKGGSGDSTLLQFNSSSVIIKKLEQCKSTGTINLSSCQPPLHEIPNQLFELYLNYSEQNNFWEIETLKALDFSFNSLIQLSSELLQFQDIQSLKLRSNQLTTFYSNNESLENFQSLKILDLSMNQLISLPNSLMDLKNLRELQLGNNRLITLPSVVFRLSTLRILDAQHNQLTSLGDVTVPNSARGGRGGVEPTPPRGGRSLASVLTTVPSASAQMIECTLELLIVLNLSNNHLSTFPSSVLETMKSLETLDLSSNQLTSFPSITTNKQLKYINLSQNHLTEFPVITIPLPCLSQLILSYNRISSFPAAMITMIASSINEMLLHNNQLISLPIEIEYCQQLKVLDLSNNNLNDLIPSLGYLPFLQILKVEGNCIKTIRQTLLIKPTEELKKYLRTRGPSILTGEDEEGVARPLAHSTRAASGPVTKKPAAAFTRDDDPDEIVGFPSNPPAPSFYSREITAKIAERINDINPKQGLLNFSNLSLQTLTKPFFINYQSYSILSTIIKVDLSSNQLTDYPQAFLEELVTDFQVQGYQYINLSRNLLGKNMNLNRDNSKKRSRKLYLQCTLDLSENTLSNQNLEIILSNSFTHEINDIYGLILHHNPLKQLLLSNSFLLHCSNLQHLELQYCQLTSLEDFDLQTFPHLQYLDISNNRVSQYPLHLDVAYNLEFLSIENNEYTSIPTYLGILPKLKTLLIQGNPQKLIRTTIISQGSQKVIEYLKCRHPASNHPVLPLSSATTLNSSDINTSLARDVGKMSVEENVYSRSSQEYGKSSSKPTYQSDRADRSNAIRSNQSREPTFDSREDNGALRNNMIQRRGREEEDEGESFVSSQSQSQSQSQSRAGQVEAVRRFNSRKLLNYSSR